MRNPVSVSSFFAKWKYCFTVLQSMFCRNGPFAKQQNNRNDACCFAKKQKAFRETSPKIVSSKTLREHGTISGYVMKGFKDGVQIQVGCSTLVSFNHSLSSNLIKTKILICFIFALIRFSMKNISFDILQNSCVTTIQIVKRNIHFNLHWFATKCLLGFTSAYSFSNKAKLKILLL